MFVISNLICCCKSEQVFTNYITNPVAPATTIIDLFVLSLANLKKWRLPEKLIKLTLESLKLIFDFNTYQKCQCENEIIDMLDHFTKQAGIP